MSTRIPCLLKHFYYLMIKNEFLLFIPLEVHQRLLYNQIRKAKPTFVSGYCIAKDIARLLTGFIQKKITLCKRRKIAAQFLHLANKRGGIRTLFIAQANMMAQFFETHVNVLAAPFFYECSALLIVGYGNVGQ